MTTLNKEYLLNKIRKLKRIKNKHSQSNTINKIIKKNTMNNDSLLTSVTANIEFYFPLAVTTICQEFVNNSDDNIEGIYQFPLPKEAGFIAFKTTLNDVVYSGEVKGRSQAENDYEDAITNGDTSILVEKIEDGLYQINVGNLLPGDKVLFELTLATLMELTPNSSRYYLPTVIANYYGKSYLDEINTPKTNFLAEYPFTGTVNVGEDLQAQRLESAFNLKATSNQNYDFSGYLDQDFVINVALSPIQQAKALYSVNGDNEYTSIATVPAIKSLPVQNANVQLLVDCSGSMSGYSIEQAKEGMACLFNLFSATDNINLFRFGSRFDQVLADWQSFEGKAKSTLRRAISALRADLGGTELLGALKQTLDNAKEQNQSDILLLTDGQIWREQELLSELINTAIKRNCRVSIIGLGNSVNEALLANLANKTGGFATFVNPNENIAQKITTLLAQMKSARGIQSFEQVPHTTWQKLPTHFVNQMPTMAYMMGKEIPEHNLLCKQGEAGESQCNEQSIVWHKANGMQAKALTAIAVTQRMFEANNEDKELLATNYQQISEYTSFIMVAEREEKQTSLPKLKHVPQMQVDEVMMCMSYKPMAMNFENSVSERSQSSESMKSYSMPQADYLDEPAFLRQSSVEHSMNEIAPKSEIDDIGEFLENLNDDICFIKGKMKVPSIEELEVIGLQKEIIEVLRELEQSLTPEQLESTIIDMLLAIDGYKLFILDESISDFLRVKIIVKSVNQKDVNRLLALAE